MVYQAGGVRFRTALGGWAWTSAAVALDLLKIPEKMPATAAKSRSLRLRRPANHAA